MICFWIRFRYNSESVADPRFLFFWKDTMNLKEYIREFPDFPKPGILFKDISPILKNHDVLKYVTDQFYKHIQDQKIDVIVGTESRGLMFAAAIAAKHDIGFVMVRKAGKLPGLTEKCAYDLEYGSATLEMQREAIYEGQRVWIVDDLLATGGTAKAAAHIIEILGGVVAGFSFAIELTGLKGRDLLEGYPVHTLVTYDF